MSHSKRHSFWIRKSTETLSEALAIAKQNVEVYLNRRIGQHIDKTLKEYLWSDTEVTGFEKNLPTLWRYITSNTYPVFSIAMGNSDAVQHLLSRIIDLPVSDATTNHFAQLFDGGWLDWEFPLGTLRVVDFRAETTEDGHTGDASGNASDAPNLFSEIDIELFVLQSDDEAEQFTALEVHGLGETKYVYRKGKTPAAQVVVFANESLPDDLYTRVSEAAKERHWHLISYQPNPTYDYAHTRQIDRDRLAESLALFIPESKLAAFARMTGCTALRKAEARDVIRFSFLLASAAGSFRIPTTVISFVSAIHTYMLLRIAWISGKNINASALSDSFFVVLDALSINYGIKAVAGTTTCALPVVGKFLSGFLLAGITEKLGESAIDYYLNHC